MDFELYNIFKMNKMRSGSYEDVIASDKIKIIITVFQRPKSE